MLVTSLVSYIKVEGCHHLLQGYYHSYQAVSHLTRSLSHALCLMHRHATSKSDINDMVSVGLPADYSTPPRLLDNWYLQEHIKQLQLRNTPEQLLRQQVPLTSGIAPQQALLFNFYYQVCATSIYADVLRSAGKMF